MIPMDSYNRANISSISSCSFLVMDSSPRKSVLGGSRLRVTLKGNANYMAEGKA
jgi:hypothetical protein